MEKYIKSLKIKGYRGIKDLELKDLKDINIIVGDNNSGKTSLLESLLFFQNSSVNNILTVCSRRDVLIRSNLLYQNFIYAFPKPNKNMSIEMEANFSTNNSYRINIQGQINKTIIDGDTMKGIFFDEMPPSSDNTIDQFNGVYYFYKNEESQSKEVHLNVYNASKTRIIREKNSLIRMSYISPIDYVLKNSFNTIIRNDAYKEICIGVLKLFDDNIEDLFIQNDEFGFPVQMVKNKLLGNMPLSTYGDGIKRIVNIASGIAEAHDGILLIDEFETAIHVKNYDDIFKFIQKACQIYHVQLFVTTHSIEAVDALLKLDRDIIENKIKFITLRKDEENYVTLNRSLSGKEVKENRELFGFEVRL